MKNGLTTAAIALIFGVCSSQYAAAQKYADPNDAAVAQAKIWQSTGHAASMISSDGKVVFAYGQAMPKMTCSPTRACDIEMEPGEKVKKVILGDGVNWQWEPAESIEQGKTIQHIVVQPKDKDLESNMIVTTDRRTYHIKVFSPKVEGAYINRMGFYYPAELVSSWDAKMKTDAVAAAKEESLKITPKAVDPSQLAFDYKIEGVTEFTPLRVFNNGDQVFIAMPDAMRNGENPSFLIVDERGKEVVVNYRRKVDEASGSINYVVDKLFAKGELRRGTEVVKISWIRKDQKGSFNFNIW